MNLKCKLGLHTWECGFYSTETVLLKKSCKRCNKTSFLFPTTYRGFVEGVLSGYTFVTDGFYVNIGHAILTELNKNCIESQIDKKRMFCKGRIAPQVGCGHDVVWEFIGKLEEKK